MSLLRPRPDSAVYFAMKYICADNWRCCLLHTHRDHTSDLI